MNTIKRLFLPFVVVAVFIAYVVYSRTRGEISAPVPAVSAVQSSAPAVQGSASLTVSSTSSHAEATGTVGTVPPAGQSSAGQYKDGTYTGSIADAYYGNVQVQAVVSGGAITDVQFLQAPSDSGNSAQISRRSAPLLRAEAIQAQSAHVNVISGATQTSQAFQQSLSAALNQAS